MSETLWTIAGALLLVAWFTIGPIMEYFERRSRRRR